MIPSSRAAKAVSLLAAIGLVGGGVVAGLRPDPVELAGGASPVEARFGTSFQDLSAGTLTAEPAADAAPPAPAPEPEAAPDAPAQTPDPAEASPESVRAEAEPARPAMPRLAVPAAPETPLQAERPDPARTVAATRPAPGVVAASSRPAPRVREVEEMARAETAEPPRPDPPARGNAERDAVRGAQTGQREATARAATGTGQSSAAGNAAASNYPGEVMARLSRVPRPSVRSRGSATISFSVAASGGLAAASVASSSGSADLDRAAIRLVQSAAPFPAPPTGARRSFSIRISGD